MDRFCGDVFLFFICLIKQKLQWGSEIIFRCGNFVLILYLECNLNMIYNKLILQGVGDGVMNVGVLEIFLRRDIKDDINLMEVWV